jgi:hypothetical protein
LQQLEAGLRAPARLITFRSAIFARSVRIVPDRFDLGTIELRNDFPKQPAMFFQQFLGKLFFALA